MMGRRTRSLSYTPLPMIEPPAFSRAYFHLVRLAPLGRLSFLEAFTPRCFSIPWNCAIFYHLPYLSVCGICLLSRSVILWHTRYVNPPPRNHEFTMVICTAQHLCEKIQLCYLLFFSTEYQGRSLYCVAETNQLHL